MISNSTANAINNLILAAANDYFARLFLELVVN